MHILPLGSIFKLNKLKEPTRVTQEGVVEGCFQTLSLSKPTGFILHHGRQYDPW